MYQKGVFRVRNRYCEIVGFFPSIGISKFVFLDVDGFEVAFTLPLQTSWTTSFAQNPCL